MTDIWISNGNSLSFGTVPLVVNTFEQHKSLSSGEIRLSVGDKAKGYLHLQTKHEDNILKLHGISAIDFVAKVCADYHEIYYQNKTNTLLLKKYNGLKSIVIAGYENGIYHVITAFPVIRDFPHKSRKEDKIWER
jgi:hypothetical protein